MNNELYFLSTSTIPSSYTISPTHTASFLKNKSILVTKCSFPQKCRLFPRLMIIRSNPKPKQITTITFATGTEVSSDKPVLSQKDKTPKSDVDSNEAERSKQIRKRLRTRVKDEELIPGRYFRGKVKSVKDFGAFLDFGAFTDGLVHVSKLSGSYISKASAVVTVGQEVKVKLVRVDMERRKITLTMREKKGNQGIDDMKRSQFVMGQYLDGTVKSTSKSGACITLPEEEEDGFLPMSEEAEEGSVSRMEIGQKVKVRVLGVNLNKVTLSMKKEETELIQVGEVYKATNPFVLAFRKIV